MSVAFPSDVFKYSRVKALLTNMVTLEDLAKKEYEVEGRRLKPTKVWKVQPKGRKGFVMALFKTPDGKTVRKVIAKVDEQGNIIT